MLAESTRTIGLRERLLLVRSINNFGLLSERAMVLLAEHALERRYAAGDVVQEEGKRYDHILFVVRGEVEVSRCGTPLVVADDGSTIGMVSLLARDPRGIRAVATKPTHALAIPIPVIHDIFEQSRSFLRAALRFSAKALVERRGHLPVADSYETPDDLGPVRTTPPTLVERIIEMRTSPLFANRNIDAVVDLARLGTYIEYEPGQTLWRVGDPSAHYLIMKHGRVRCTAASGAEAVVAGDYTFGIMESMSYSPRTYTALTETHIQGTVVDFPNFLVVLENHHELAMDILATLSWELLPKEPGEQRPSS